jgi:hypothetical protein
MMLVCCLLDNSDLDVNAKTFRSDGAKTAARRKEHFLILAREREGPA